MTDSRDLQHLKMFQVRSRGLADRNGVSITTEIRPNYTGGAEAFMQSGFSENFGNEIIYPSNRNTEKVRRSVTNARRQMFDTVGSRA